MTESADDRFARLSAFDEHHVPPSALRYTSRFRLLAWDEIDFEVKGEALVKGLLTPGGFSVIYGESGSRKTHFITDLALHIARGMPWFHRKVMLGGVVYIAAEGGLSMRRRLVGYRQHNGLRKDERIPFMLIPSPVNLLDSDADLPELLELIQRVTSDMSVPLRLIIVDTLSRAIAGGNENAPDHMGHFVRSVDQLRDKTGAHVSVIHHAGKNPNLGARSHSLLRATADTEIELSKAKGGPSTARVTKQRDGADGDTFAFDLQPVELGQDEDGDTISTCVLVPVDSESTPSAERGKKSISSEAQRALNSLSDVIAEQGQPLGRAGMSSVKAVQLSKWRDRLKQDGHYKSDAKGRQEFHRMKLQLVSEKLIIIEGNFVWKME